MHLQICVEDASGKIFLDNLLPRILIDDVSWRVHPYRGIGKIPKGLKSTDRAEHRILLECLPKLIRGFANTPHVSALILVVDTGNKDCAVFLAELKAVHAAIAPDSNVIFGLAIEEMEAWLLGDPQAIEAAYPKVIKSVLSNYLQDSVCGTWEVLANAVHPGGSASLIEAGWRASGEAKCKWANDITSHMNLTVNGSPSFSKLLEAIKPFSKLR